MGSRSHIARSMTPCLSTCRVLCTKFFPGNLSGRVWSLAAGRHLRKLPRYGGFPYSSGFPTGFSGGPSSTNITSRIISLPVVEGTGFTAERREVEAPKKARLYLTSPVPGTEELWKVPVPDIWAFYKLGVPGTGGLWVISGISSNVPWNLPVP